LKESKEMLLAEGLPVRKFRKDRDEVHASMSTSERMSSPSVGYDTGL
jgi:hypothetical protein